MIAGEKTANAVGGRTARACESCLRRRARWYCAADDAFLCGGCDASVHSANQLAQRHERVRLGMAPPPLPSSKPDCRSVSPPSRDDSITVPAWHGGFTRKARTPRRKSLGADGGLIWKLPTPGDLVPELSGEFDASTGSMDESDDGFQCLVPVFDPFAEEDDCDLIGVGGGDGGTCDDLDLGLLLPSEVDLEEFAVDVESLLGEVRNNEETGSEVKVKDELLLEENKMLHELGNDEAAAVRNFEVAGAWEVAAADWDLEFSLPVGTAGGEEVHEEKSAVMVSARDQTNNLGSGSNNEEKRTKMLLRLNYEEVITAWASHGSPWTSGARPDFRPGGGWPKCTVTALDPLRHPLNFHDLI